MENGFDVVFGTGPLGLAVMDELLKRNKDVVLVNRSGKAPIVHDRVRVVKCDALDQKSVISVCQGATTIYHCIGLPYTEWKEKLSTIMDNLIEGASQANAKIVYGDNLYAYGPQNQPLTEDLQYNPVGVKTRIRAEVATKLMNAHHSGKVIATIGKGSDFYGPRVINAVLGNRVFEHLLMDKKVELIGNPNMKHSHIFIEDFARGLVTLGNEEKANGEIFHLPHEEAKTNVDLVNIVAKKLSVEPKFRIANTFIVKVGAVFSPFLKEMKELMYQHTNDFIVDSSKFEKTFGWKSTSFDDGIEKTIDWYKNNL